MLFLKKNWDTLRWKEIIYHSSAIIAVVYKQKQNQQSVQMLVVALSGMDEENFLSVY